jgi:galactokinase
VSFVLSPRPHTAPDPAAPEPESAYPKPANAAQERAHDFLGRINQRLLGEARAAFVEGDAPRLGEPFTIGLKFAIFSSALCLGRVMNEAQGLFDSHLGPLCDELKAPLLHRCLAHASLQPHIYGGKGVGSQGDGSAQLLCRSPEDQMAVMLIITGELHMLATPLTIKGANY